MKYDCDRRRSRKKSWHRWFAWYPVKIGPNDCRWLECVERKGTYWCSCYDDGWTFEYRPRNG